MSNKDPGPWPFVVVPTTANSVTFGGDNGVPWPFKMKFERMGTFEGDKEAWSELVKAVLLGKRFRVFRPGSDIGTTDYVEDRVNIYLSDSGHVENVTFG